MDLIDKRILRIVQKDARLSIGQIATQVGLSPNSVLEKAAAARFLRCDQAPHALLDPVKLGLGLTVLVSIEVGDHAGKSLARFATEIAAMEEVMEFYRLAGDVDYFLRVVVPDAPAFDAFYKRLIEILPLK
jgi:Lrp/AsnC family transcriptional regulator